METSLSWEMMRSSEGKSHFLLESLWLINTREYTGVLSGLGLDRGRLSLAGRDSDIRPLNAGERDDTDTFVFNVPPRADTEEASSPISYAGDSPPQIGMDQEEEIISLGEEPEDKMEDEDEDRDSIDNIGAEEEPSILLDQEGDLSMENVETTELQARKVVKKKKAHISKHGLQYPSLPAGVVKKLAMTFARTAGNSKAKLSKETLDAIMQASNWFFEQASEDLSVYAGHAGRKTIDESDVVTLMTRYVYFLSILLFYIS